MRRRSLTSAGQAGERGQAFVESALVLIVFVSITIGIADFGQFLYLHQSLTERVRAAARYGAVRPYDFPGDSIRNVAVYGTATPAVGSKPLVPGLKTSMVTANLIAAGTDAARIKVTVSNFPFNFFSPWIAKKAKARAIIASIAYERGR